MTGLHWLIVIGAAAPFVLWLWWDIRRHRAPVRRRAYGDAGTAVDSSAAAAAWGGVAGAAPGHSDYCNTEGELDAGHCV